MFFKNIKKRSEKMLTFLSESTRNFEETPTIGGFQYGNNKNTFDDIFTEAYENLLSNNVDCMMDLNMLIKNKSLLKQYKDSLLSKLYEESCAMKDNMAADDNCSYGTPRKSV